MEQLQKEIEKKTAELHAAEVAVFRLGRELKLLMDKRADLLKTILASKSKKHKRIKD